MLNLAKIVIYPFFLMLSFTSLATTEDTSSMPNTEHLSFINGYSIGKFIAQGYQGKEKENFLQGLQKAFEEQNDELSMKQEITEEKARWFKEGGLDDATKAAYAYGYLSGQKPSIKEFAIDYNVFLQGMVDALLNPDLSYLDPKKANKITKVFNTKQIAKHKQYLVTLNNENLEKGKSFLKSNAQKQDVITLDNGLQYKVIKEGAGNKPALNDFVELKVIGKKINGDVFFDSEKETKKPIKIKVGGSIKGWKQALSKMPAGAIWELYVPAELAYGNIGWRELIEPGETLIYQIELVSIEASKAESE